MAIFTALCMCAIIATFTEAAYVNSFDGPANVECQSGQSIGTIQSIHSNQQEDRRWEFTCRSTGASTRNCDWSPYVNDWDDMVAFMCPGEKVMSGMYSYHDNRYEDRRFKFQCCDVVGKATNNCYITNYANNWDGRLLMHVPGGKILKGAFSYHANSKEDRRWKFMVCDLSAAHPGLNIVV